LIAGAVPVPTAGEVCGERLLRVEHEKTKFIAELVHARSCRKISSGLCTTMKHCYQRQVSAR
jgi:hypothetical protein